TTEEKPLDRASSASRANSSGGRYRATSAWRAVGLKYWPSTRLVQPAARRSSIVRSSSSRSSPRPSRILDFTTGAPPHLREAIDAKERVRRLAAYEALASRRP